MKCKFFEILKSYKQDLTSYDLGLFEMEEKDAKNLADELYSEMLLNMQYYYEHCKLHGYVTPKKWLEEIKHF